MTAQGHKTPTWYHLTSKQIRAPLQIWLLELSMNFPTWKTGPVDIRTTRDDTSQRTMIALRQHE